MILGNKNIQPDARALDLLIPNGGAAGCVRCVPNRCVYGGELAGENATDVAFGNVAIGYGALEDGTVVSSCVCIGYRAGQRMNFLGALNNVMVGLDAGRLCTDGSENTYLGQIAGYANTTGDKNTCVGQNAGKGLVGSTTYNYCTYIGRRAGVSARTGDYNTGCGSATLNAITTGAENTALGFEAGKSMTTSDGCVFLGHQAGANNTTADRLYIDNSNAARPLIFGEFGNDNVGINANAFAGGTGCLAIYNTGTIPVGGAANSAIFYVSAGEMWVQDSGGVNTQLSSHKGGEWVHRDIRNGREYIVYLERLVREFERMTGKKFSEVLDA